MKTSIILAAAFCSLVAADDNCTHSLKTIEHGLNRSVGNRFLFENIQIANLDTKYAKLQKFINAPQNQLTEAALGFLATVATTNTPNLGCSDGYLAKFLQGMAGSEQNLKCSFDSDAFPADFATKCTELGGQVRSLGFAIGIGDGFDLKKIFDDTPALQPYAILSSLFKLSSGDSLAQANGMHVCIPSTCDTPSELKKLVGDAAENMLENLGIFAGTSIAAAIVSQINGEVEVYDCKGTPPVAYSVDISKLGTALDNNTLWEEMNDITNTACPGGGTTDSPTISPTRSSVTAVPTSAANIHHALPSTMMISFFFYFFFAIKV